MKLVLAMKDEAVEADTVVVEADKVGVEVDLEVAEEDEVGGEVDLEVAEEDEGVANEDQTETVAANHRHSTHSTGIVKI
jgi:hypothetical protein